MNVKEKIAKKAVKYLGENKVINLGIGIPTLISDYIPEESNITLHSENGILGVDTNATGAEIDPDLVNAGKLPVTVKNGASFFDSAQSFAMIRGGHIDAVVIGALQVDEQGIIANWSIPGRAVLGVGGAMDLIEGVKQVIVVTTHTTKDGKPKIVDKLQYPKTSRRPADLVITDLAVFKIENNKLYLEELQDGVSLEEVTQKTAAKFFLSEKGVFV